MKLSKAVKDGYSKADCKGSHFRVLRNVGTSEASELLQEVHDGCLPLQKLNTKCTELKKIRNIMKKFVEPVSVESWEIAKEKFPVFACENVA